MIEFMQEMMEFVNKYMTSAEQRIAFFGLICLVVIYICGCIQENKEKMRTVGQ